MQQVAREVRVTSRGSGIAPRDRDPRVLGQRSPSQCWDRRGYSIFLHTLVWVRGASFGPRVLQGHLPLHRQAREARLWAKAEDEAHRQGRQGFRGRVYAITPPAESANQPVIQGTFLLSHLWARVLFDYGASHSFIVASVVIELGLEVEALEEPL